MTRMRHPERHGSTGITATASPPAIAEFAQTLSESGQRFIVSRAELFERLARCSTPAEATAVTATWFQHRLSEVAEQNQRLFQAWLAMGMSGWNAAAGSMLPAETATHMPPPPAQGVHHTRDIAA